MPILKKFIGNDQVDGSKTLLLNDQALRAKNASGVAVELMKYDSADVLQFLQLPQVSSDPVHPNELARKSYVENLAQGVAWKAVARATVHAELLPAYTYANGTGGVGATITANANGAWNNAWSDSVALAPTDRVVVYRDGIAGVEYGIYVVSSLGDGSSPWVLTRSDDCDGSPSTGELLGATITVIEGASHAGTTIRMNTPSPIIVGTTPLLWDHISSGLSYSFGDGLQVAGTDVSVKADAVGGANLAKVIAVSANGVAVHVDDSSIGENMSGQLYVKAGGITAAMLDTSYLPLSGGTMTGTLDMGGQMIDMANEVYVDDGAGAYTDILGAAISMDNGAGATASMNTASIGISDGTNISSIAANLTTISDGITTLSMAMDHIWSDDGAGVIFDIQPYEIQISDGTVGASLQHTALQFQTTSTIEVASGDIILNALGGGKIIMNQYLDMSSQKISNVLDPVANQDAATKKYVDDAVAGVNSASEITFTPAGNIVATNVQAAIEELDTEKLALAGGTMTGSLVLYADPTIALEAATKGYVDTGLSFKFDSADFGTSFDTAFGMKTTSDLTEGTNLYYTSARFDTDFGLKSTDNLSEGISNLYFTDTRAKSAAVFDGIVDGVLDVAPSQNAVHDALALKLDLAGGTMSGSIDMGGFAITSVLDPLSAQDAATKKYVDDLEALDLRLDGSRAMTGPLDMGVYKISNVVDPTLAQDAATKNYVDGKSVQEMVFESNTLTAPQIAAQSVSVASNIVGTPWIQVGTGSFGTRVSLEPNVDFEWSGSTITFKAGGPIATGGAEELVLGDKLSIYYMKSVTLA